MGLKQKPKSHNIRASSSPCVVTNSNSISLHCIALNSVMEKEYTESSQHLKKPRISEETNLRIKTELCRRFMQGLCVHGSKCNYAHGFTELRTAPKVCRMFLYNRHCTYGNTCRYLHSSLPLHHDHGHGHHSRINVSSSAAKPGIKT